jgi:hypothetical protein
MPDLECLKPAVKANKEINCDSPCINRPDLYRKTNLCAQPQTMLRNAKSLWG